MIIHGGHGLGQGKFRLSVVHYQRLHPIGPAKILLLLLIGHGSPKFVEFRLDSVNHHMIGYFQMVQVISLSIAQSYRTTEVGRLNGRIPAGRLYRLVFHNILALIDNELMSPYTIESRSLRGHFFVAQATVGKASPDYPAFKFGPVGNSGIAGQPNRNTVQGRLNSLIDQIVRRYKHGTYEIFRTHIPVF